MRVISEGEDYAETTFFTNRRDSHAGNTMAAQAFNNSRFTYDYLTRSFAQTLAPLPLVGQTPLHRRPLSTMKAHLNG